MKTFLMVAILASNICSANGITYQEKDIKIESTILKADPFHPQPLSACKKKKK